VRIEVKGRNLQVTDELREVVARRFEKVDKQVSELARLDIELYEERNPANPQQMVAEATLHLKGVTLRAKNASSVSDASRARSPPRRRPPWRAPKRPSDGPPGPLG
jgi:ribosomal subunit interface protein